MKKLFQVLHHLIMGSQAKGDVEDHLKRIQEIKLTEKQWREISCIDTEKYDGYLDEKKLGHIFEEKYLIQPYDLWKL